MGLKAQDVYAILNGKIKKNRSFYNEKIIVNDSGELELVKTLGNIYIDMNDGYLKTDISKFSVDKDGYLIIN